MNLVVILGPTACGKTTFATHLAQRLGGEIISADSRQVYRGMSIGTGKDLVDYEVDGFHVPYHLIDICEAGEKYNVYRFQNDFFDAFQDISSRGKLPLMCGGTGLYIESVLKGYRMINVPPDQQLRERLSDKSLTELEAILATYRSLHNSTDTDTKQRAIRAIEIEEFYKQHPDVEDEPLPAIEPVVIGLNIEREARRRRISERLKARLDEGMVDEVRGLLNRGIKPEDLIYYGLEYKYLTLYVIGHLSYDEMVSQLEIAIHQFAKRQMTWFRGMETRGTIIHWIDALLPMDDKIAQAITLLGGGR
ncbi:MAG: tRNA (adenosine(37)-N6)-dimethylallyltransferase MiaA [Marinilabiliaceae bacterium]|nr:tRNA (adenosine(37)-N6)-dimethylallyltransferase MiaA [Marinilabiliaceae bacterium]